MQSWIGPTRQASTPGSHHAGLCSFGIVLLVEAEEGRTQHARSPL